jgi:carbon monoxide dehydrogenase subunit G
LDIAMKMTATVCIEAPPDRVWAVLSKLEDIHLWVRSIRHSYCPGQSRGVGALRVCELSQATVRETIVAWEEGRSFTYSGEGAPMMKRATNTWSVSEHEGKTLVTSVAEVELKGGPFGVLFAPLVRIVATRLGAQSLASLKYLVERGEPYLSDVRLPVAPATC